MLPHANHSYLYKTIFERISPAVLSLLISLILILGLLVFFNPIWESNDDVGMSMVAHGYGIALFGSEKLVFSNVLWGHFIRLIPTYNGILGYSIATLGSLVLIGSTVLYALRLIGVNHLASLSIFSLLLVRPIIFPQFTINAGLLLVAGVVYWRLYAKIKDTRLMWLGCFFALMSFLVRYEEFFLVLLVALPLLPWKNFKLYRTAKVALLFLVSAIIFSSAIDRNSYQKNEWIEFNELNNTRSFFTDRNAGELLKQRQDILLKHNFSSNDIDLIGSWFFVDSQIADPKTLNSMLKYIDFSENFAVHIKNGLIAITSVFHPRIYLLFITAIFLYFINPNWKLTASWSIFLGALFLIGFTGRPGVLRIYVPVLSLLVLAPFLTHAFSYWRQRLVTLIVFIACIMNSSQIFSESQIANIHAKDTRTKLINFPNYPVVVWGGIFPYEEIYTVLGTDQSAMRYNLYALGTDTLAPYSVAYFEKKHGRGMIDLLVRKSGVAIIASEKNFEYLEIYCREHLNGKLQELSREKYGKIFISRRRCVISS